MVYTGTSALDKQDTIAKFCAKMDAETVLIKYCCHTAIFNASFTLLIALGTSRKHRFLPADSSSINIAHKDGDTAEKKLMRHFTMKNSHRSHTAVPMPSP